MCHSCIGNEKTLAFDVVKRNFKILKLNIKQKMFVKPSLGNINKAK